MPLRTHAHSCLGAYPFSACLYACFNFSFFESLTLNLFLNLNRIGFMSIRPVEIVPVERLAVGKMDSILMLLLSQKLLGERSSLSEVI